MRRASLILLALLLFSPPAAAQDGQGELPFSFRVPGQAGPDLEVSRADWILLLFHVSDPFHAEVTSEQEVHVQEYEARRLAASYLGYRHVDGWSPEVPTRNGTLPAPFHAAASHPVGDWGSLYVAGEGLRLVVQGQSATIESKRDDQCIPMTLEEAANQTAREETLCRSGDHAVVAVRAGDGRPAIRIVADRVHEVEWHGLRVDCPGDCPSGGVREDDAVEAGVGGVVVHHTRHGYTNLQGAMALHGNGTAALAFAGGGDLRVDVDGWVRLPAFSAPCQQCTDDDQTFQASGHVRLDGLRRQGPDRLSADLSGDLAAARLDETVVDPAALLGIPVGVLGAAGAVAVLWKLAAWLATRDILRHPRRRLVLDAVKEHPGIHFRALERSTGLGGGSLRHHLDRLVGAGLLVQRRHRNVVCFFENHGRYGPEWRALALLRDPEVNRLHAHAVEAGGAPRSALVQHAQTEWGWSQRTTYRRIRRLLQVGLLAESGRGLQALQVPGPASPTQDRRGAPTGA